MKENIPTRINFTIYKAYRYLGIEKTRSESPVFYRKMMEV